MTSILKERELKTLNVLGRVMYATSNQLDQWGIPPHAVSRMLPKLEKYGLVQVIREARPNIIALTHKGGNVVDRPLPSGKSYTSWAVMAHRCYRNEVELALRQHYPRFTFFNRKYAYAKGLNPARSEHGGSDENGKVYLVVLDDYLMQPRRIAHCWTRPHSPNTRYYNNTASRRWRDVADHLVVVSSDLFQVSRHKQFLEKCADIRRMENEGVSLGEIRDAHGLKNIETIATYTSLPESISVIHLPPLWDLR